MKIIKNAFAILMINWWSFVLFAQEKGGDALSMQEKGGVEMADVMRSEGKIYVVVATVLIIFLGIVLFLFLLERRMAKLEQ